MLSASARPPGGQGMQAAVLVHATRIWLRCLAKDYFHCEMRTNHVRPQVRATCVIPQEMTGCADVGMRPSAGSCAMADAPEAWRGEEAGNLGPVMQSYY